MERKIFSGNDIREMLLKAVEVNPCDIEKMEVTSGVVVVEIKPRGIVMFRQLPLTQNVSSNSIFYTFKDFILSAPLGTFFVFPGTEVEEV